MEPYYESWQAGAHRDIGCIECHIPPGLSGKVEAKLAGLAQVLSYTTGSYKGRRPAAQVPDANCTGCHSEESLGKPVQFKGLVMTFRHDVHLKELNDGIQLRCTSCHTQMSEEQHIAVAAEPCWICHLSSGDDAPIVGDMADAKPSDRCLVCHEQTLRANENIHNDHTVMLEQGMRCQACHGEMSTGTAQVNRSSCQHCHFGQTADVDMHDTESLHDLHIQRKKVECIDCHNAPEHESRTDPRAPVPSCATCHSSFHGVQSMVLSGEGFSTTFAHPAHMLSQGVSCEGCHTTPSLHHGLAEVGETLVTTEASCRACHTREPNGDFGKLLGQWKEVSPELLTQVEALYEEHGPRFAAPGADPDAVSSFTKGKRDIALLRAGNPVHNVWFARDVVHGSYDVLAEALSTVTPGVSLPEIDDRSALVPDDCRRCHFGVTENLTTFERPFSHTRHVGRAGLDCRRCHDPDDGKAHGRLQLSSFTDCSACHHDLPPQEDIVAGRAAECGACHSLQSDLYLGRWQGEASGKQNLMAGTVHCVKCHFPGEVEHPVRPGRAECAACHDDPRIVELLPLWQANVTRRMNDLEALLATAREGTGLGAAERALVMEADEALRAVRTDGSLGIHNPGLVDRVLSGYIDRVREVLGR
jgi:hypothetical protein